MKIKGKYLFVILTTFSLFTFCKKEDSANPRINFLTSKTWKVTAYTVYPPVDAGNGIYYTDVYQYEFTDCLKNAEYYFYTEGTGKTHYSCFTFEDKFTWAFMENYTEIKYQNVDYDILQLNETTFQIRTNSEVYPIYTMTYTAN
jgi:hypothetical protein